LTKMDLMVNIEHRGYSKVVAVERDGLFKCDQIESLPGMFSESKGEIFMTQCDGLILFGFLG
jgi:hypothetical protein